MMKSPKHTSMAIMVGMKPKDEEDYSEEESEDSDSGVDHSLAGKAILRGIEKKDPEAIGRALKLWAEQLYTDWMESKEE